MFDFELELDVHAKQIFDTVSHHFLDSWRVCFDFSTISGDRSMVKGRMS